MIRCILLLLLIINTTAYAAFEEQDWSARATGMGNAFVAVADEGCASFYNPAGISQLHNYEVDAMYTSLYPGLDVQSMGLYFASVTVPIPQNNIGVFGLSWASYNVSTLYAENTLVLNYANSLSSFLQDTDDPLLENLDLGVNLKYLGHSFVPNDETKIDPVFANGYSKYAFTFDVGLLEKIYLKESHDYFKIGVGVFNIIPPNVGLAQTDPVQQMVKVGLAYPLGENSVFESLDIEDPLSAFGVTYQAGVFDFNLGWENKFFNKLLALRFGSSLEEFSFGTGFSFSFSSMMTLELDYAFSLPYYVMQSGGTHKITFIARF